MTTISESQAAPRYAKTQRFSALKLLRVDETKASPEDSALVAKVRSITTPDEWDKALAGKNVAELFRRGVLYFGQSAEARAK